MTPDQKDKHHITISDLLKATPDGLSIQDIITKTGLARHTILARLHNLEGQNKVQLRKVGMAKLYSWSEKEQQQDNEHVQLTPLEEKHITTKPKVAKMEKDDAEPAKIDIAAIKNEIETKVRSGELKKHEAQIQEQRKPITETIKSVEGPGALDISSIKAQIEAELKGKKRKETKDSIDKNKFVLTGINGFDALLEKGIPKGAAILVAGGAGSGKTIFCLQTLMHHVAEGKKCLMMSFEESENRLIQHLEEFGWDAQKYIDNGTLLIKRFNPFEITRSVDALLMKAKGELLIDVQPIIFPGGFDPDFIVVDSLTAIASAFTGKEDSYRIYIEQLFRFFEQIESTSFLITETTQVPTVFSTTGVEEFLADGVVVFYNIKRGNIRERAMEVLKLRGAGHQHKIVAMNITSDGIEIYPDQEVFGGIGE